MKSTELRQTGSFISRICRLKLLLAPAAILLASPALWGQTNSEDPNSFGTLPQDAPNTTINNPTVACAPTAIIDGLTYLENAYDAANPGSQLFNNMTPAQLDTAAQVNALATDMGTPPGSPPGTAASPPPYTLQQMLDGTQTYLNNNPTQVGLTMSMVNSWETTAPGATSTAQILANLIKMGQAVMVEVTPPPIPGQPHPTGHIDCVTGVAWNGSSGTIGLVDPNVTQQLANGTVQTDPFTANISANSDYMNISTTGAKDTSGTDLPANSFTGGNITGYLEISPVPEPDGESLWLMSGACAAGLATLRRILRRQKTRGGGHSVV